ncbi:MAG TPA: hypothetical protein V6C86_14740 [Oculatellaceae cyanobacterium]
MTSINQSCSDAQERFDTHELGLAPIGTEEKRQMEQHFKTCEPCQKWLSQWELIKLEAHGLEQLEVPSSVLASIMTKIDEAPVLIPQVQDSLAVTPAAIAVGAHTPSPVTNLPAKAQTFQSDLLVACSALALLIAASLHYASESLEGTASWCFSFAVLFAIQHFLRGNAQEPQFKT